MDRDFFMAVLAGVIATVGGGLILRLLLRPDPSKAYEDLPVKHPVLRRFFGILFVLTGFVGGIVTLLKGQIMNSIIFAVIFILGHAIAGHSRW